MPYPVTIDVGDYSGASTAGTAYGTHIGLTNPANQQGVLDIFYVVGRIYGNGTNCKVGTCYGSSTSFTTREVATVGTVTDGVNTFTGLSIDVEVGDYVQIYGEGSSAWLAVKYDASSSWLSAGGVDYTDGSAHTYTSNAGYILMVYATGYTAHASVTGIKAIAIAVGKVVTVAAEISASVTGVAAVANAVVVLPSYGGTATDYPDVPDCAGAFHTPSMRIAVGIVPPAMQCFGELFDDIACGVSAVAAPCMTCACKGNYAAVVHLLYHSIYEGRYFLHPTYVNSVYVLGKDTLDQMVYGQDSDSTNISEYGEVLKVVMSPLVTTAAIATTVAGDILSNTRMEADLGSIIVPPNCGMEIGDVICITDSTVNQTAHNYRVIGHDLVYDPMQKVTQYKHIIRLTEV